MRRICVWLLCLLLTLPLAACAEEHLLTEKVNVGACRSLTGEVRLVVIFADTPQAQWVESAREAFCEQVESAAEVLEREAAGYGASLELKAEYRHACADEEYGVSDTFAWAERIMASVPELAAAMNDDGMRETPVLLCLNGNGRSLAYSAWDDGPEYAVLFSDADAGSIRHELLHLYGAFDYYIHNEVHTVAQERFPQSIMLSGDNAGLVDSLTAWCVGWVKEPDAAAEGFLADTAQITRESLDAAREQTLFTGFTTRVDDAGEYTGMMVNGLYHGTGVFRWKEGASYTGQWLNGKRNGHGVFVWAGGTSYTGDFLNGERTGKGVMHWPGGTVYTGEFLNGVRNGKGVMRWEDGSSYTGDFLNDAMTGAGVMIWPDGSCYTGAFLDGAYHGSGVFTAADGSVTTGVWEHGVLTE